MRPIIPACYEYVEGVSIHSDESALDNILGQLNAETEKWKSNQYYWKQTHVLRNLRIVEEFLRSSMCFRDIPMHFP